MNTIISPSILNVSKEKLPIVLEKLNVSKAKWLHFDVMDGKFVPNTSFSDEDFENVSKKSSLFFDVHLMVFNVLDYVNRFSKLGANLITFHYEALEQEQILPMINLIKEKNIKVGLSIKPKTNPDVLTPYLDRLDLVLVMSVEPGFGGQAFMEGAIDKIKFLEDYKKEHNLGYYIEVDGGIDNITGSRCKKAGANVLVSGSYIFKNDIDQAIENLLNE